MNYGQKIAELRKSNKLTQAELGTKLNVTAQAISKWENNLSEPDIDSIRKMCELFEVSVDEFLGLSTTQKAKETETVEEETSAEPVKVVLGYCEKCKKAVSAGEFKMSQLSYNPSSISEKVKKSETMHTYCNTCHKQILEIQRNEIRQKALDKIAYEKAELSRSMKKGLIWGAVACVIACIVFLSSYFVSPSPDGLLGTIILIVGAFTMTSTIIWDGVVADFFFFFCRSFKSPFGLIFELSLDGILWLITVKLALWILCGILSILFFILGLFLTLFFSICAFPFCLIKRIKEINDVPMV